MNRKNVSILYAEDDDNDVFLMRRALAHTGFDHTLQIAENGQLALDLLKSVAVVIEPENAAANTAGDGPVLIILDLKMPVLAGLEVLEKIRDQSSWRDLFVVMFSSSNQQRDISAAHALKANGYIIKPTNIAGLRSVTKSLLESVSSGSNAEGWLAFEGNQPLPA